MPIGDRAIGVIIILLLVVAAGGLVKNCSPTPESMHNHAPLEQIK